MLVLNVGGPPDVLDGSLLVLNTEETLWILGLPEIKNMAWYYKITSCGGWWTPRGSSQLNWLTVYAISAISLLLLWLF